ncbi:hypothetical protein LNV08_22025 [Paucibacter sp. TC2R-5]|uniref:hypothetical protein n=1 Tax=Paucibacter sp. TC2R-5 TaxID=2893555 RepID=UPI0021E44CFD|nr:hypothetical protein [Paucibacter sp. TC2R-5]MCV2361652.1 hypothetical protein [Paucibacter sp. TC2R-5]
MSARIDNMMSPTDDAAYTGSYNDSAGAWDMGGATPDQFEAAQMQPFTPGSNQGVPWWQGIIGYGITRAIDNRYGPTPIQGNVAAGSFAGQNGRSYYQAPNGTRGQVPQSQQQAGTNPLVLLGGLALAALAFAG